MKDGFRIEMALLSILYGDVIQITFVINMQRIELYILSSWCCKNVLWLRANDVGKTFR